MNNEIENIKLKFACDADWNSMTDAHGAKHCNTCQKTVYDFTNSKQQEFLQILAENNNNICGRFKTGQLAFISIQIPVWKKWVSAAMVLLGINLFTTKTQAQVKKQQPIVIKQQGDIQSNFTAGVVMPDYLSPSFPGGHDAFTKFLARNIKYEKGMIDGQVIASFIVKKDGSLSDFKILNSLGPVNDAEVLRVLKLSPRWNPGLKKTKVADITYSVPVTFKH